MSSREVFAHAGISEHEEITLSDLVETRARDESVDDVEGRLPRDDQAGAVHFVWGVEILEVRDHIAAVKALEVAAESPLDVLDRLGSRAPARGGRLGGGWGDRGGRGRELDGPIMTDVALCAGGLAALVESRGRAGWCPRHLAGRRVACMGRLHSSISVRSRWMPLTPLQPTPHPSPSREDLFRF